ncbi:MAG: acyltransferase domain-containing protein, partial [bacterium]|nr:acyltransferase domain-containing protein [bacterium]
MKKTKPKLAEHLKKKPGTNIADMAYTLQEGRNRFKHRRVVTASTATEIIEAIAAPGSEKVLTYTAGGEKLAVVFMFPGQGSQYTGMGRELYETEPHIRETMDRCFKILEPLMGINLKEILYPGVADTGNKRPEGDEGDEKNNAINKTAVAQPLIFVMEYAISRLLMHWGIKPYAMVGHSIGEYAAASIAGVLSLEDALNVVVERGRLMQQVPPGSMLGLQITREELNPLLEHNPGISPAADNGPGNITVSGTHEAVHDFEKQLKEKGYKYRRLHTSHAFHSAMMDPVLKPFEEKMKTVALKKPAIPYISNVTGTWITPAETTAPAYWAKHLRNPVRFSEGVKTLLAKKKTLYIEVGPGRALSTFVKAQMDVTRGDQVVNTMRHPREDLSDTAYIHREIGRMWLFGKEINWQTFRGREEKRRIPLPTYPFEKQRYWIDKTAIKIAPGQLTGKAAAGGQEPLDQWFYLPDWKRAPIDEQEPGDKASEDESSQMDDKRWLILMETETAAGKHGLGAQIKKRLQEQGQKVVEVFIGEEYAAHGQDVFEINPGRQDHYRRIFTTLAAGDKHPYKILHMWSLTAGAPEGEEKIPGENVEQNQQTGFYSLLELAKAAAETGPPPNRHYQLNVITNGMQDVTGEEQLEPGKSTMKGPLTVIPQEYPYIRSRSIDITVPPPGSRSETNRVQQIVTELMQPPGPAWETEVAYRGP